MPSLVLVSLFERLLWYMHVCAQLVIERHCCTGVWHITVRRNVTVTPLTNSQTKPPTHSDSVSIQSKLSACMSAQSLTLLSIHMKMSSLC